MTLEIHPFTLGPLANNTYVLVDTDSRLAVVIDPTFDCHHVVKAIREAGWIPYQIWLTHAHFDHTSGVPEISRMAEPPVPIGIHRDDLDLYHSGGGADQFGIPFQKLPEPTVFFDQNQHLLIGAEPVEVFHTPGHSPGHVVFYIPQNNAVLVGDLIFKNGIGRTDLPGGSMTKILKSIYQHILTLPGETRLLSGHGPESTVSEEADLNPYLT